MQYAARPTHVSRENSITRWPRPRPEALAATAIGTILILLALVGVHRYAQGSRLLASDRVARSTLLFHQVLPTPVHLSALQLTILAWAGVILLWGIYLWLIWYMRARRVALGLVAGATAMLYGLAVLLPPIFSTDVFSYAMFGRLSSVYDANPYLAVPAQAAAADPLMAYLSWPDITSPYGPVWSLLSGMIATGSHASPFDLVLRFKLLALSATVLDGWLIYRLVRQRSRAWAAWAYLAFAWNPLVIVDGVINGHNDVVILAFVLGAALALRRRPRLCLLFLLISALIKYSTLPVLSGAMLRYLRRVPAPRRPTLILSVLALGALVVLAAFHPFWQGSAVLASTLHEPGRGANNPVSLLATWGVGEAYAERAGLAPSTVAVVLAAVVFGGEQLVALARSRRMSENWTIDDELGQWARTTLVFLLVWPRVHTWYWLLPLGLALSAGPRYRRLTVIIVITSMLGYLSLAR